MTFHLLGYAVPFLLWTHCTAQNAECGPPPRRDHEELADLSHKETYAHGDIVFYNCRPGYIKLGRIRFRCNNGNWEKATPYVECRKRPCGHPGDLQYGSFELINGEEFVFGARVVYQCDDGYQMLSQTDYRECRVDGWSNDVPHCEVRKCYPVKEPENGRIIMTGIQGLDQEFLFGQVIRFECSANFKIQGSDQIFCTNKGTWSAPVPTCIEITCQPEPIDNGYITSQTRVYKDREQLQYACETGYKHAERSDAACTQNGWNPRPRCLEIVCPPPEVGHGRFQPKETQYGYDAIIDIECEAGYQLEHGGSTSKCTETGWSPSPRCITKPCDYPHIENGRVSDSYWYYPRYFPKRAGETIDFKCDAGFLPANKRTWHRSTCTGFGWDPEPKCFKKCYPVYMPRGKDHVPHGRLNLHYSSIVIEGEEVSFYCESGYYPVPSPAKTTCTKTGWGPTPRCAERATCKNVAPLNGYFSVQKHQFTLHETVTYGCQSGYTTPDGRERQEIQCIEEGWQPKPECIKTCQKPSEETITFISATKLVFVFGEKVVYECKDGYETTTRATGGFSVCTGNDWHPKPECHPIQCDHPLVDNGFINPRKDQYLHGDVVQFKCRKSYTRVGTSSAQCYHFGWSPPPPACKAQVSPCSPPSISNGSLIGQPHEGYSHGDKVEYECNVGFAMAGPSTIECVDGVWSFLPSCTVEEKTCGRPPNLTHGHPVSVDGEEYFHGERMSYECEENFVIAGSNPAKCLHGKWELPSCVDDSETCTRPQRPTFVLPADVKVQYNNNEVAKYHCGSKYHKTTCVHGKWSPKPQCEASCPPPPRLPNAIEVAEPRNYENGDKIRFTCHQYFLLQGPQEILCVDGKWQTPPRCIDGRCDEPPTIANGDVKNSTQHKYVPGESVQYQCQEGFEISGLNAVTCRNMTWSQVPTCKEKPCGQPPKVLYSSLAERIGNTFHPGKTVHYKCHPGFAADGPLNVTCQRGEWTEPPTCEDVTCREPPTIDNGDILNGTTAFYMPGHHVQYQCHEGFGISGLATIICQNKTWSNPPVCEDVTCHPPPAIPYGVFVGQRKERYLPNEKVRYHCIQDRSLFGSPIVKCENKQWTARPTCRAVGGKCGPPPAIENGDILESLVGQYNDGSIVNYKCQNMYRMEGSEQVRCSRGHWTEAPTCIEPCTATEEDMQSHNIQLKWRRDQKLYSRSGDEMEFICRRGFRPDPTTLSFRAHCIEGNLEYPRCIPIEQREPSDEQQQAGFRHS